MVHLAPAVVVAAPQRCPACPPALIRGLARSGLQLLPQVEH